MQTDQCRIGIIGAGTSGVYLAQLLIQQGFQVDLFERSAQPRTEGCGILIVQAGMLALAAGNPDICRKIIQAGAPVSRFEFRNLRGGVISSEPVEYADDELPGMLVHRKDILEALFTGFPTDRLHGDATLTAVTQTEHSVIAQFQDGRQWEGDVLVGADGILSAVRQSVVPDVELSYLGDLVWRGVVDDKTFCPKGEFIVYARGRGVYANFFDIGGDRTHWGFFIEVDQADTQGRVWFAQNPGIPATELAKIPADARAVIEATPPSQIVSRYSYDIDPLPRLHSGRIVLIGDAAHAKSPSRARGMTSGWEDGLALTHHLSIGSDVQSALAAFEAERMPIVHEYQRTSRDISRRIGRNQQNRPQTAA